MIARIHSRVAVLGALALVLSATPPSPALAASDNLPIYTSPIDITGLNVQLRLAAPDRETGKPIDVALPVGLLGPKMNALFSTPLSSQIDQYWNATVDPDSRMTARAAACDAPKGIKQQVAIEVAKMGSGFRAYDIACNLASTGQLVAKQLGSTMYVGYLLKDNSVSFASTSPGTCAAGHGTPVCPNDPRFTVHFATELVTIIRTPGICQLTAESGTVYVVAASIESRNGAADAAKFFVGKKFIAAELAITETMRKQALPIDGAFSELRTSAACTGRAPGVSRILTAFRDLQTEIDLRQGIILRASHAGITAPVLDAPNPGAAASAQAPSVPSFTRPMISTSQPVVTAGGTVQTSGRYFPPNVNFSTSLPVTLQHGGYGPNSHILGGVCYGGETQLSWGPAVGRDRLQRFPGDAQGGCTPAYDAANLTPGTAYHFRARDCDPITCSPWSATLRATTATVDPARGRVVLTLDGGTPLGTAVTDTRGTFATPLTIPAGTPSGPHTIHAAGGAAKADVAITVAAPVAAGAGAGAARGTIVMVALLRGESGCPNHPINSTQTDDTFTLFGTGFAAGTVTIRLDGVAGVMLGSAPVRSDGTICGVMRSATADKAGAHTIVAVQNGAVAAQTPVTFVLPSGVR